MPKEQHEKTTQNQRSPTATTTSSHDSMLTPYKARVVFTAGVTPAMPLHTDRYTQKSVGGLKITTPVILASTAGAPVAPVA